MNDVMQRFFRSKSSTPLHEKSSSRVQTLPAESGSLACAHGSFLNVLHTSSKCLHPPNHPSTSNQHQWTPDTPSFVPTASMWFLIPRLILCTMLSNLKHPSNSTYFQTKSKSARKRRSKKQQTNNQTQKTHRLAFSSGRKMWTVSSSCAKALSPSKQLCP